MEKIIKLKPINVDKGFVVDDELVSDCEKKIEGETNKRIVLGNTIIACVIAAFLEKYEDK